MENEYLEKGFDPSTLKVAKLRGILFDNNVEYASNAKKPELLALFHKHIRPKSAPVNEPVFVKDSESEDEKEEKPRRGRKAKKDKKEKAVEMEIEPTADQQEPVETVSKEKQKKKRARKPSKKLEAAQETAENENGHKAEQTPGIKLLDSFKVESSPKTPEMGQKTPEKHHKGDPNAKVNQSGKTSGTSPENRVQTPVKSPETSSRKRKSMLEQVDLKINYTPSKGNIFEVDSESEPELLSSRRKKPKHALLSSSPRSPFFPKKRTPNGSFGTPKAEKTEETTPNLAADAAPKLANRKSRVSVNSTPKIEAPVLQDIAYHPSSAEASAVLSDSTNEPSLWFKTQQSFEEQRPQSARTVNDTPNNSSLSHSFDSALSKLKRETRSEDVLTLDEKKAELAKLLNIDVSSIRPKAKGKRTLTPRRPIIVPPRLLSHSSENPEPSGEPRVLPDDVSQDDSEDEDETVDLAEKEAVQEKGKANTVHVIRKAPAKHSVARALAYLSLWIALVGALFFGYWYREQTLLIGYCGSEINRRTIPDTPDTARALVRLGEYLDDNFKPECVECPQHARCFPRLEIACYDDFVESAPWYYPYFPNVNPRAQKCVPDTKKAEKIEIMIDVALDLLRARNAHVNCGRADVDDLTAGLEVSELHDLLLALKAPYITTEEFEELWERSVVELEKEPEIIVRHTAHFSAPTSDVNETVAEAYHQGTVLRSTSLSHISVKCMISNTVLSLALRFKKTLVVFFLLSLIAYACYWKYQEYKLYARKVDTLYHEVLSKLQRQAKLGQASRELPEFIGSVQLRDLILSNERNLAYKMRLWQAVSQKVDNNTNVKHELLEVHGEVMKVWQWISHLG